MRILLVNRWYPPYTGYGGVAVHNYYLAHALARLGNRVAVLAARWSPDVPALTDEDGVRVYRILARNHYRLHRLPGVGRYMRPLQQLVYSQQVARRLRTLEASVRPDVVEFADVEAEALVYLSRRRRCPTVVRCHAPTFVLRRHYTAREQPYDTDFTVRMEKRAIRRADALTTPSHNLAQIISSSCGVSLCGISVIPNPLDVDLFAPGMQRSRPTLPARGECAGEVRVLYVGRFDRLKGVETLARAIPLALRAAPGVRFTLAGDDRPDGHGSTWQQRLGAYFRAQQIEGSIHFAGAIDQPELPQWYGEADIALVPSLYESFSYTCAQALASGLPVVASRIGGMPELVEDGVNGLLTAPGNAEQLAAAVVRLARDPRLRSKMGQAGRAKAEGMLEPNKVARQMLAVYAAAGRHFESRHA